MKIKIDTCPARYPESRKHFILNLIVSLWFVGEKERIIALNNPKRTKLWNRMDPFNMVVEPPVLFEEEKMIACLIDRPAGVLLPDRKVPLITFDEFLEKSLPSDNINTDGDYNEDLAAKVEAGITVKDLYTIIHDKNNLSTDPIFYLTKIDDSDEYVILYDNKDQTPDFDTMVSWVFRDYDFEDIVMEASDDEDGTEFKPSVSDVSSFYTGTVKIKDSAIVEKTLTFNFVDLKLLSDAVADKDTKPSIIDTKLAFGPITAQAGKATYNIDTTALIYLDKPGTPDDLKIVKFIDGAGQDITQLVSAVFKPIDDENETFEFDLTISDYMFPLSFANSTGLNNFTVTLGTDANEVIEKQPYKISWPDGSLTTKIEKVSKTEAGWDVSLYFKDSGSNLFTSVVQPTFNNSSSVLDESGENAAKYNGGGITFTNSESGYSVGVISVTIDDLGDFTLKLGDSAFKEAKGFIVDPEADYTFQFLDSKIYTSTSTKAARFELYKDGEKINVGDGRNAASDIAVTQDGVSTTYATGWTTEGVDAAILSVGMNDTHLDEPVAYTITGKYYIGSNQVPVDLSWSGNIPETAPVKAKPKQKNNMLL